MNKSLTRSPGFWLLLVLSLTSTAIGGWLIAGQIGTMTSALLDGTATGVEVYVGQSLVVVGAALLGTGILGVLLAVALTAVRSLLPSPAPVIVEPIDWSAERPEGADPDAESDLEEPSAENAADDQNGSSGSIATATKISVR